jgi:glycine oxidase
MPGAAGARAGQPAPSPDPSLRFSGRPRVIVIGAGVVGLTTARALQAAGAQVCVLERGPQAGRESTWAGGGIVSPLRPWRAPPAVWQLIARSRELYPPLAAELRARTGVDIEYQLCGARWQVAGPELAAAQAWHREQGLPCTVFSEDGPSWLRLPWVGQVRNPRLGRALAEDLQAQGGEIRTTSPARLLLRAGRVAGAVTAQGQTLEAEAVVVCAGAWAGELLQEAGLSSPVRPVKGQMLLKQLPPGLLAEIWLSDAVYLIPRADGHLLIGSTLEPGGFDKTITAAARQTLQQAADQLCPAQSAYPVIAQWAGLRPGSPEGIPQLGAGALPGLWLNTGHYRNGIGLAPACAEALLAEMLKAPLGA